MWIPKTIEALEKAVADGHVEESATLDFKRQLPSTSTELAKDIAAMANDGGVLIFGVGEDKAKRPTELCPLSLSGVPERISSIAGSGISPHLHIEISTLSRPGEDLGYVVVEVPRSPMAPHMVVVRQENCFFGRCAGGNRKLEEAEISRLYERRRQWETDRDYLLDEAIENAPCGPVPGLGFLHIFGKPVASDQRLLAEVDIPGRLREIFSEHSSIFERYQFSANSPQRLPNGWRFAMLGQAVDPSTLFVLDVLHDGSSSLFKGRIAENTPSEGFLIFDELVANLTMRYLYFLGQLYRTSGFVGQADLGWAATGIRHGRPFSLTKEWYLTGSVFASKNARGNSRVFANDLSRRHCEISQELLFQFCHGLGIDFSKIIRPL
jgi:hypothetical protein